MKVVAGQMSGETGMILQLIDNIATLFLDSSRKEVKLFTRDLTESADIVAGIDRCTSAAVFPPCGSLDGSEHPHRTSTLCTPSAQFDAAVAESALCFALI